MDDKLEQDMAAECIVGRVRTLSRVVNSIFDRKYRLHGVRSSQVNILVVVAAHGPLSPTEVCRKLCLDKSTLSRDLDRLIDHQWISSKAGDGRRLILEITQTGRELIRKLQPAWAEAQTEVKQILGSVLSAELFQLFDEGRHLSAEND